MACAMHNRFGRRSGNLATIAALFLTTLCPPALQALTGGFEAAAQGTAAPPKDAPILSAGQRVERPFGAIEISKFTSAEKDENTEFTVWFLIRNESANSANFRISNSLRLIADGVPRAPGSSNNGCCGLDVAADAADYGWATFLVSGRPKVVYLQIGTSTSAQ